jgi:hypothetical protein
MLLGAKRKQLTCSAKFNTKMNAAAKMVMFNIVFLLILMLVYRRPRAVHLAHSVCHLTRVWLQVASGFLMQIALGTSIGVQ